MSDASKKSDPTWNYTTLKDPKDTNCLICLFCGKVSNDNIARQKEHLIGTTRKKKNITSCSKVPIEVKEELLVHVEQQRAKKRQHYDHVLDFDDDMAEVEEVEVEGSMLSQRRKGKGPAIIQRVNSLPSSRGSTLGTGVPKKRGPMDVFLRPDPKIEVQKRKMRQTIIPKKFDKEARDRTHQYIVRWFYQESIAFNDVTLHSFKVMLETIEQYGPGLTLPSFHQLGEPLLKKEVNNTKAMMETHKAVWATKGCSLMSDGWTDRKDRILINFLVNSPRGTVFIESIDASSYIKTGEKIFEMLSKMVERVGEKDVVQVITDNASNMKLAGKYLEQKFPQLYWTPCAAHCLDLILENIGKLSIAKSTLKRAIQLSGFIYGHGYVLNMMREFTKEKELLRPGMTRFATSFLTLASIHKQKHSLRTMFISEKWTSSRWSKEQKGREAAGIVAGPQRGGRSSF